MALLWLFIPLKTPAFGGWCGKCAPYGDYCTGDKWGWYGERRAVTTKAEAITILKEYFRTYEDLRFRLIGESPIYYKAEVKNREGKLIDIVIIDKRTGRLRSIY